MPDRTVARPSVMAFVAVLALFTVSSALSADRSGNVATYRNDAEHKADGERCLQILTAAGMKPATVDGFFAVVTVPPADTERAQHLIADAIEHGGLHVRLTRSPPAPDSYFEQVAWYYDKDTKDGRRADAILSEHKIQPEGAGMSGTTSISTLPEHAAEARRLLAQVIKAENLRVTLTPAEERSESPGALFFLKHLTTPADISPDGRQVTRLIVVKNIEVYPLTFTTEEVWKFEVSDSKVATTWSPDARFLMVAVGSADETTDLYAVDLTTAQPNQINLGLRAFAEAASTRHNESSGASSGSKWRIDLGRINWRSPDACELQLTRQTSKQLETQALKLDLSTAQPALTIE